jgi:AraC-like DNA-binding protein
MSSGTVVLRLVDLTWARLIELGASDAELSRRVVRPTGAPWRRVPFETVCDLVEAGLELVPDPHLGLRLSLDFDARQGGVLLLLMLACKDVRSAALRLVRYQRLLYDAHRVDLEDHERRLILHVPGPARPAQPHLRTWMCADAVRAVHTMTGVRAVPLEIAFQHAAPPDRETLERFFGCPISFEAPRTLISFDESVLSRPLRHANETFRAALEEQARELAGALPSRRSWRDRARASLAEELPEEPTLESTAARLRLSARTLQRRLRSEGTSVAELLAELRRELAARYLEEERDVSEIAYLLGYASPSSFHRAFRAWFGTTPRAFRSRRSSAR